MYTRHRRTWRMCSWPLPHSKAMSGWPPVRDTLRRIAAVSGKEVRQLLRDRVTFAMIVGLPLLQIVLFGYAINTDVRHLRAGVADMAHTQLSRTLVAEAQASQVVDIVAEAPSAPALEKLLDDGRISVGIYI